MEIDKSRCIQCNLCEKVCIRKNIDVKKYAFGDNCFQCYHCMAICPKAAIFDNGEISNEIKEHNIKPDDFENLIYNKRSYRFYSEKEVSKKDLEKIAGVLRFSPTGTNNQKLHMTIIGSREKMKELSDMIMKSFRSKQKLLILFIPFLLFIIGLKSTKRILRMLGFIDRYFEGEDILSYNAPSLFIFHCPKTASTPEQDGVIASTIGTLYAESLGFASCFNGFMVYGINFNRKIKKHLNIPKKHKVYSTFLLGYPKYKFSRGVLREKAKYDVIS
jgi:nitroreductase/NAD-dependent dihydropyrimidine dehydrogenase PreA subunit